MSPVENYTTKIAATKTASEIQETLAAHGVTKVMLEYADGTPRRRLGRCRRVLAGLGDHRVLPGVGGVTGNRCGAPTPTGPCRRRVRHEGDSCHLHPCTLVTLFADRVDIELMGGFVLAFDPGSAYLRLPERAALKLAQQIHAAIAEAKVGVS